MIMIKNDYLELGLTYDKKLFQPDEVTNSNNECCISPKQIHLYTISLDRMRDYSRNLVQTLNFEEFKYANSYASKHLTENYIISRSLLRHILSHYTNIPANTIEFELGTYGKPYLKKSQNNNLNLHFNLSHTKDMLCIALTMNTEVGVDIEFRDHKKNFKDLYYLTLSKQELEYINSLNLETTKLDFFYSIWTLKEAIVKALGFGLFYKITKINLLKDTNKICRDITLNVPHISKKIVFPLKKFIRLNAQISPMLLYPVSNKYNSNINVVPNKQQILYLSLHEILSGTQYFIAIISKTTPKNIKFCNLHVSVKA